MKTMNKAAATKAAVLARMALSSVASLKELARLAGLADRTMYHWIGSPRNTEILDKVATALRTTSSALLEERDRLMGPADAE